MILMLAVMLFAVSGYGTSLFFSIPFYYYCILFYWIFAFSFCTPVQLPSTEFASWSTSLLGETGQARRFSAMIAVEHSVGSDSGIVPTHGNPATNAHHCSRSILAVLNFLVRHAHFHDLANFVSYSLSFCPLFLA